VPDKRTALVASFNNARLLFIAFWIDLHTKYTRGIKDAWLHETCDTSMEKYYIVLNLHGPNVSTTPITAMGAGNVYLLVLSSWKVNIAENPIAVMGL
jgi:hypothetical protein